MKRLGYWWLLSLLAGCTQQSQEQRAIEAYMQAHVKSNSQYVPLSTRPENKNIRYYEADGLTPVPGEVYLHTYQIRRNGGPVQQRTSTVIWYSKTQTVDILQDSASEDSESALK